MNFEEAKEKFTTLFENKLTTQEGREFLLELYSRGESVDEIAAAATVMREHVIPLDIEKDLQDKVVDIVGTGGDKSGTFNISSTASFVVASLGVPVAKHGNRAVTSKSGSADMLEALGINLTLPLDRQAQMLRECGFAFMFANNHHPAMKFITPIRHTIPHRTIFNIIGPITNPAGAKRFLLGVYLPEFTHRIASALLKVGATDAFVVSSNDGLDEVTVSDVTLGVKIKNNELIEIEIDPESYGIKKSNKNDILGGDAKQNALITKGILENNIHGAMRDIVLLNSACALEIGGAARDIKDGLDMAKMAIESGKTKDLLQKVISISQK